MSRHIDIDSEFKALIPPLSSEEFTQLEANILADGCRDPLVVWAVPPSEKCPHCGSGYKRAENEVFGRTFTEFHEETYCEDSYADESMWICDQDDDECDEVEGSFILLDGHNRYEICQQHGVEFSTVDLELPDRQAAINWIINNQLGRRNLHPDQASYLRGKRYNGEKRQDGGHGDQKSGNQIDNPIKTHERLAEEYKVSPATARASNPSRLRPLFDQWIAKGSDGKVIASKVISSFLIRGRICHSFLGKSALEMLTETPFPLTFSTSKSPSKAGFSVATPFGNYLILDCFP